MAKFFFTVRNADIIRDPEGSDAASISEAIKEARDAARQVWAEGIRRGRDRRGWSIDIEDTAGHVLRTIRFDETADAD